MANLCENRMVFLGTHAEVAQAYTFLLGCVTTDTSTDLCGTGIDLNLILPEPEGLFPTNDQVPPEVRRRLIDACGFWNTTAWRISNWGQRWNFLEINHEVPPQNSDSAFPCEARVSFDSAWSPVLGIAAALSARFPGVGVILLHEEGGNDMYGGDAFLKGDCLETIRFSAGPLLVGDDDDNESAEENTSDRIADQFHAVEKHLSRSLWKFLQHNKNAF